MPIKVKVKTKNSTERYLEKALNLLDKANIRMIAEGALLEFAAASPNEEIAKSWSYEIISNKGTLSLFFTNSQVVNGQNIAIIIDVGHATKNGYWVSGTNYLSKPTKKAYDKIIKDTWEALKSYE